MAQHFRSFIDTATIKDSTCTLTGEELHYLKNVLRVSIGDTVELRDGTNKVHTTIVEDMSEKSIRLTVTATHTLDTELPINITLAQGLPKADKMELIIQKCVELGVHDIIPVETARSIVKITKDKEKGKTERWNKISKAAALQSGRGIVPNIGSVHSWAELIKTFKDYEMVLTPWEMEERTSLKNVFSKGDDGPASAETLRAGRHRRLLILIGPEGGFSPQEIEEAVTAGAHTITLGKRILRTETAGMAILAMINFIYL